MSERIHVLTKHKDGEPEWMCRRREDRWYFKDEEALFVLPVWGNVFPHDFLLLPPVLIVFSLGIGILALGVTELFTFVAGLFH